MTYVLTLATEADRDLVVDALKSAGDQRTRVARQASRKVAMDKRAGKDVRSAAVRVTAMLAEADALIDLASSLAAQDEIPVVRYTTTDFIRDVIKGDLTPTEAPDDDGTSAAAQHLAALAGLDQDLPDEDADDIESGALTEDDDPNPTEVTL